MISITAALLLHVGEPLAPHDVLAAWSFEPGVVLPLLLSGWLYLRGVERLWRRAGMGRGIRGWEAASFAAGWAILLIALVSPVHRLGDVLFSAHMVQHELLIVLAAPLLVLGRPLVPMLWAVPQSWRRSAGAWTRTPAVRTAWRGMSAAGAAFLLHAIALWAWHMPPAYQLTLTSDLAHTAQHFSFLGTAVLFWWALIHGSHRGLGYGAGVLYVFATATHSGVLGALLTFASRPWYPAYGEYAEPWGLTALEDQHLAGLIMWVPGSVVYIIAALAMLALWMQEAERRTVRWQAARPVEPAGPAA